MPKMHRLHLGIIFYVLWKSPMCVGCNFKVMNIVLSLVSPLIILKIDKFFR